jgi:hypothetical protein
MTLRDLWGICLESSRSLIISFYLIKRIILFYLSLLPDLSSGTLPDIMAHLKQIKWTLFASTLMTLLVRAGSRTVPSGFPEAVSKFWPAQVLQCQHAHPQASIDDCHAGMNGLTPSCGVC